MEVFINASSSADLTLALSDFFQILGFVVILEGAFLTWRLFSFIVNNITGGISHL